MANSSFVQTSFLSGEISQTAQGRLDLPSYKMAMNICFNHVILETGAVQRRPGTRHVAINRGGGQGRMIPFTFTQSFPYNMVFTDGFLRFTNGPALVMTNDAQPFIGINSANPVLIQTDAAHGWSPDNSIMFNSLGTNFPLLQNRQFKIAQVPSPTTLTLADPITGAGIDGATLAGTGGATGNITRILEIATIYDVNSWSTVRSVQAESRTALLNGEHPQVLQVASQPTNSAFATFTLGAADFIDGPYLDPVEGSIATPSGGLNGVITLTLSFQAWDSTRAYNVGDYVSNGGLGYRSLTSPNQAATPATSPSQWVQVNGGAPYNNGAGFQSSDIGRLVRLFSEPTLWVSTQAYTLNQVVAYADGEGGYSYWTATGSVAAGIQPGTSALWAVNATAARWTWGQITSASGGGLISSVAPIGSLSGGGGLAAAFDGNTAKGYSSSATITLTTTTYPAWSPTNWGPGSNCQFNYVQYTAAITIVTSSTASVWTRKGYPSGSIVQYNGFVYQAAADVFAEVPGSSPWVLKAAISTVPPLAAPALWISGFNMISPTLDVHIGQHYTTASAIGSATLYPTIDVGFANSPAANPVCTVILRGKATAPSLPSDGTSLGVAVTATNTAAPVTIISNDQTTTWNYIWFEIVLGFNQPLPDDGSHVFTMKIGASQAQFFQPTVSNGSVVTVQIRGPALLYNLPVRTWRAGVYSNRTGWPTSGTYHEGRIWLGGVVSNRFDACVSNGLSGTQMNFAPTAPNGAVTESNAISYTCTGENSNQILWMKPDQQGILFGTQAGEWLISAPSPGPLSPTNVKAVRVTKIGCANIEPQRAEHTLLFVHKFGRKIMEYFADVYSGKFSAPNLSKHAKHMTVKGIAEIAYQQELTPTIWARRTDGFLLGAIYQRDTLTTSQGPNIIGWHRHALGSGRLLESLCVGPSQGGNLDSPSMITNDLGTGIRHIEVMTDVLDEGFALTDCFFLDNGIIPTSHLVQDAPTGGTFGSLVLNGLWPHNGSTVTAFVAGLDCGDFTVASGSITIPFGDSISSGAGSGLLTAALVNSFTTLPAVVGFTYNSDGQLVRPVTQADTGAQAGPGWAKIGRQSRAAAQMYGMVNGSISFGNDFNAMYTAKLRYPDDTPYTVQQQWSGIWRDNVNSALDFDGMLAWRISRPLPGFIMAAGGFTSKADV